jgi:uncharacterized hydrophobic protein (TIGR00271 family)
MADSKSTPDKDDEIQRKSSTHSSKSFSDHINKDENQLKEVDVKSDNKDKKRKASTDGYKNTSTHEETEELKKQVGSSFFVFFRNLYRLLMDILDLRSGSNVEKTNKAILDDIEFRGANVWALISSIIIASIGLNINSTAVVIGAMLISPLMGPIIGMGWSIAVNDIGALNKSIKNFLVMVFLGIATSFVYFFFSPLRAPSAELIGRTSPTILDLFIAFFGGIAGIVSMSKSGKVNVILGVAIATALIPPLCTAGYGLAEGRMEFFVGAFYLFLINSVFIALASFIMIRYLRFPLKKYLDPKRDRRVKRILISFGILVMIPSAYTFYTSIVKFRFDSEAERFVNTEIKHEGSKVLRMDAIQGDSINSIELYMIGEGIDSLTIATWTRSLKKYQLDNTVLNVYQDKDISSGDITGELESTVRRGIVEDLYRMNQEVLETKDKRIQFLEQRINAYQASVMPIKDIDLEARSIVPEIERIALGESYAMNDSGQVDTLYALMVTWDSEKRIKNKAKDEGREKLSRWLSVRLKKDSILVLDAN